MYANYFRGIMDFFGEVYEKQNAMQATGKMNQFLAATAKEFDNCVVPSFGNALILMEIQVDLSFHPAVEKSTL